MSDMETIVSRYLKDCGFDGLCNLDLGCWCGLDDLMICEFPMPGCIPALKAIVDSDGQYTTRNGELMKSDLDPGEEVFFPADVAE